MRRLVSILTPTLLAALIAVPALAQQAGVPLAQVERKYRQMSEVHILKCDYNEDGFFTKPELICVQGIYRSLYLDRD